MLNEVSLVIRSGEPYSAFVIIFVKYQRIIRLFLAFVWVAFGLAGKLLQLTPRHLEIVSRVVGPSWGETLTLLIGVAELLMAVWILSGKWPLLCGALQMMAVLSMNVIELLFARELLLWGPLNFLFALIFTALIFVSMVLPNSLWLSERLQISSAKKESP